LKASINLILLLTIATFVGCVGTIEDANKSLSKAASSTDNVKLEYPGIISAVPISNDKVEVFFPQSEIDADNAAYVIRYDGLQIPIYVYATSLRPDYRGLLRYTIKGLFIDTNYSFSVQVRDVRKGVESNNTVLKQAKTFANLTANYDGISEVRNLSGDAGTTGIEVLWVQAETKGGINKDEIDPIEYQVTVIDGSTLNPGSMNDTSFSEPTRKVISAGADKRSVIINGLVSGRKYYMQVRAIHYGYTQYSADRNYQLEKNTRYLEISTYSDDMSNILFDDASFRLSLPAGSGGLYSISASWSTPEGNFDHYRLYYALQGATSITNYLSAEDGDIVCSGPETTNAAISCLPAASDHNLNNLITGLQVNRTYDVVLAICTSMRCERAKRMYSSIQSKTTTPAVADFQGIKSIDPAKNLSNLDQVTLNFDLPNFLSGNISGYVLRYYGADPSNSSPMSVNDSDVINLTGLGVLPYNVQTDTSLTVTGIDPLSIDQYCFMLVPFSYNVDGTKNFGDTSNVSPRCVLPSIKAPDKTQFPGIEASSSLCDAVNASVTLKWSAPTSGIFSNYEIFYVNDQASFSFGAALDYATNSYSRIFLGPTVTDYRFTGLQSGTTYRFGVLTYYSSIDGPIRSEYNTNFFSCSL
jgi:hypothetical protein